MTRQEMLARAQALIDEGNFEEAEKLVNDAEKAAKTQANLNAMTKDHASDTMKNIIERNENKMNENAITHTSNIYDSIEYRTAFMHNVLEGTPIPAKFANEAQSTKTTDVAAVIPSTTMQRIVEKLEEHGQIYALVTKTNIKGGVTIPTSSAKPVATWVAEGASSDTQKKTIGSITFSYFKLRCPISMSLEVSVVSLDFFETVFVNQVTNAMIAAIETAIIKGDGTTRPKGILTETVVSDQNVNIALASGITYDTLWNMMSKIPSGYRAGVKWFMNWSTFCTIQAMTDTQGQPIARVNYGLNGDMQPSVLGRPVVFSDDIDAYTDAVSADTIVAFLFRPEDYILNTNLAMTVKRYEDNDTEDQVIKGIMLVDGKVIDKNSLVTLTKKSK